MGRKKRNTSHLRQYGGKKIGRKNKSQKFKRTLEFVIGLIYCGFPETEGQVFSILTGNDPPSYRMITKAFNFIRPILKQLALDSAANEMSKIPPNASVSIDGSWDHRRDGKLHILDAICVQTKKIIGFSVLIRISQRRRGNTFVSPQAMEGEAFKEVLPHLMSHSNIIEIIKDGDVQLESIILASGWKVKITPDPNHQLKHFDQYFEKCVEPNQNMFRGICKKLLKKFKDILYSEFDKPQKMNEILNLRHFILEEPFLKFGRAKQPNKWKYADNQIAIQSLDKVLDLCRYIISTFERGHSTCLNESYHYLKAKYLNKNFNLGNTADVRLYASILHFNIGKSWLNLIYERLKLPFKNLAKLEKFYSASQVYLKKLKHKYNYSESKAKDEENEQLLHDQLQVDIRNRIPLHK